MPEQHIELTWLDASESIGLQELAGVSGMSPDDLAELVDYGALAPLMTSMCLLLRC